MRPLEADTVLLLLFAFTVVVISVLLLLQVYMVCFLKRAAPQGRLTAGAGPLLAVARDAAPGAPAVEGEEGEACGAAVDVSTSWACLPGFSRGWVGDEEAGDCVVCLSALGEEGVGGGVRVLPKCRHAFHAWCIGRWLVSHSVCCPICRTPARPDTPAAPVVATTSPPSPPPPLTAATAAAVSGDAEAVGGLGGAMVEYLSQRGAVLLGQHQMTEELHLPLLLLY